ncbi:MAG: multiprotein bridging factor aMBF1 [Candidatus Nanohaloarchaea archaeon]|nr:multiprotein bridging factor aMBF1 [Candidatus Nanohaloarchaea archaeon]
MQCEMCGQDAELKKTKVEGAVLKLCEECRETGEVMETSSSSSSSSSGRSKSKSRKRSKPREQREELVRDFDKRVKEARESEELSIEDLADMLNEKESVIHRIESGKLKPDKRLAQKIKNQLEIELYEEVSETDYEAADASSSNDTATIGDVADVTTKEEG